MDLTMEINFYPNKKQFEAIKFLNDDTTTEILYGGGASGGKTFLGCAWIIMSCLQKNYQIILVEFSI